MLLKRFFAYSLDSYIINLIQLLLFSLYRFITTGVFRLSMLYIVNNFLIIYIFLYLSYFFISEYLYNKTVGKKLFKLEVIFAERDLKSIMIRTIIRLVPIDIFFILIFKKTLHDILSKTDVILSDKHNKL